MVGLHDVAQRTIDSSCVDGVLCESHVKCFCSSYLLGSIRLCVFLNDDITRAVKIKVTASDFTAPLWEVSIFSSQQCCSDAAVPPSPFPGPPRFLLALKTAAAAALPPFTSDKHGLEMLSLEVMRFCLDRMMTRMKPPHTNEPRSAK